MWLAWVATFHIIAAYGMTDGQEIAVAFMDGDSVYGDEYSFHESLLQTEVASRFMQKHEIRMSPDFWMTGREGQTPSDLLRDETLRSCAWFRVVQQLGVENGILQEKMSYRQFLRACQAENQRRKEMKARGNVFYGPVEFRQDAYFGILFDQIIKALERQVLDELRSSEQSGEGSTRTELEAEARKQMTQEIERRVERMRDGSVYCR